MVVQAALGIELHRGRHVGQVRLDQRLYPVGRYPDDLRPDLLVVADHHGTVGQAQHRQREDVRLRRLVHDHHVEQRLPALELLQRPVDRHDPDGYRVDRFGHRPLRHGLPVGGALAGTLADLAERGGPVGQRRLLPVVQGTGDGQPGEGDDEVAGQLLDPVAAALDLAAERRGVDRADGSVEPGLRLPPLPGPQRGLAAVRQRFRCIDLNCPLWSDKAQSGGEFVEPQHLRPHRPQSTDLGQRVVPVRHIAAVPGGGQLAERG